MYSFPRDVAAILRALLHIHFGVPISTETTTVSGCKAATGGSYVMLHFSRLMVELPPSQALRTSRLTPAFGDGWRLRKIVGGMLQRAPWLSPFHGRYDLPFVLLLSGQRPVTHRRSWSFRTGCAGSRETCWPYHTNPTPELFPTTPRRPV